MTLHERADWILTHLQAAHTNHSPLTGVMQIHINGLIRRYNRTLTHDPALEEKIEQIEYLETTLI